MAFCRPRREVSLISLPSLRTVTNGTLIPAASSLGGGVSSLRDA
jgi:hypothetical protein